MVNFSMALRQNNLGKYRKRMVKMNVYYPFLLSGKDMSNLKTLLHKERKK